MNKDTFKFQAGTSEASDLSIPEIDFQSLKKAVLTNLFLDFLNVLLIRMLYSYKMIVKVF